MHHYFPFGSVLVYVNNLNSFHLDFRLKGDSDTLVRMCGVSTSGLANLFSKLAVGEEFLFDRS